MALTDQQVSAYNLDESSGNATDSTGNGYTFTNVGTFSYAAGKINNGADFGSGNSSKALNRTADTMGLSSNNAATWSCNFWLNMYASPASGDGNKQALAAVTVNGQHQFQWYYWNDGGTYKIRATVFNGSTATTVNINLSGALSTGTFVMVTLLKNGTNLEAYVNGSSVGTTSYSIADGNAGRGPEVSFGYENFGHGGFLDAKADIIGFWSRVLTSGEITSLYNGGAGIQYPYASANGNFFLLM